MKRICKNIVISTHLFDHPDLSVSEKWVLIAIDSVSDSSGVVIGTQAISSLTGLPTKEVKSALKSLQAKGAIDVMIDEDGAKRLFVYLWKERYVENPNNVVVGDSPSDIADPIDYGAIQDAWNEHCHMLPKLERMTPARKSRLRSVLKQSVMSVEDFIKCFKIIACTPFLNGSTNQFKATYEWLTSSSKNATKVFEGFYSRTYQEKRDHELIRNGGEVNQQSPKKDDYYR